jgi:hypothetical protein
MSVLNSRFAYEKAKGVLAFCIIWRIMGCIKMCKLKFVRFVVLIFLLAINFCVIVYYVKWNSKFVFGFLQESTISTAELV